MLKVTYDHINETLDPIMSSIIFAVSFETIETCAKKLNLIRNDVLVLESLEQEALFYEYCLFHFQVRGNPLITTILDRLKPELTDEENTILDSYKTAKFAVLRVESIVDEDAVIVFDVLEEKPLLLPVDQDAYKLKIDDLFVCHLMDMTDFGMTTAAWIRFPRKSWESTLILDMIKELKNHPGWKRNPTLIENYISQIYKVCLPVREDFLRYDLNGKSSTNPQAKEFAYTVLYEGEC